MSGIKTFASFILLIAYSAGATFYPGPGTTNTPGDWTNVVAAIAGVSGITNAYPAPWFTASVTASNNALPSFRFTEGAYTGYISWNNASGFTFDKMVGASSAVLNGNGSGLTSLTPANIAAGTMNQVTVSNAAYIETDGTVEAVGNISSSANVRASHSVRAGANTRPIYWNGVGGLMAPANGAISILSNSIVSADYFAAAATLLTNWPTFTVLSASNNVMLALNGGLNSSGPVFGGSGCLISSTGNVAIVLQDGLYTNKWGYNYTNYTGGVGIGVGGTNLTVAVAGKYRVAHWCSFAGPAQAIELECAVFTNGVECTLIEWIRDTSATSAYGSASAEGILDLPANCTVSVRLKCNGTSQTVTVAKHGLVVGGAN